MRQHDLFEAQKGLQPFSVGGEEPAAHPQRPHGTRTNHAPQRCNISGL
jgi:hypothetical protein